MREAGIPIPGLCARDGLAAINGSNFLTGMDALSLHDAERWTAQAEIAAQGKLIEKLEEALAEARKPWWRRWLEL